MVVSNTRLLKMVSQGVSYACGLMVFCLAGRRETTNVSPYFRSYQDRDDFFALFNDGLLHAKPATFSNKYIFKRIDPVLQVSRAALLDSRKAEDKNHALRGRSHRFSNVFARRLYEVLTGTGGPLWKIGCKGGLLLHVSTIILATISYY